MCARTCMPQVCSCVLLVLSPETLERTPATLQNAIGASVRRAGPFSKQYENLDRLNNFDCYRVGVGTKHPLHRVTPIQAHGVRHLPDNNPAVLQYRPRILATIMVSSNPAMTEGFYGEIKHMRLID